MAIRMIDYGSEEYNQMVALREDILRKPLSLTYSAQELEEEKDDILICCFDEDKMEGCCILTREDNKVVQLRQMAISSGLQGKGIGRTLMQFAENIARDLGYEILIMHARCTAVGFYEKLGYKVKGKEFIEVTIPHVIMEKNLLEIIEVY